MLPIGRALTGPTRAAGPTAAQAAPPRLQAAGRENFGGLCITAERFENAQRPAKDKLS
jgi:hypothetical protein